MQTGALEEVMIIWRAGRVDHALRNWLHYERNKAARRIDGGFHCNGSHRWLWWKVILKAGGGHRKLRWNG